MRKESTFDEDIRFPGCPEDLRAKLKRKFSEVEEDCDESEWEKEKN